MKIDLFKFNETSQAVNTSGTLKKDLDRNIKVKCIALNASLFIISQSNEFFNTL